MIKLLLDQGLPRTAASFLRERGFDAQHVGDLGLHGARDSEILEIARKDLRACCTMDSDFHKLLAVTGAASPSVIRIRIEGLKGAAIAELLVRVLGEVGARLNEGVAVTVSRQSVRVRKLPLSAPPKRS